MSSHCARSNAFLSRCRRFALAVTFVGLVSGAQAQTQASCSYTFLQNTAGLSVAGINDWGTVVGTGFPTGFVRWANGGLTFPSGTTQLIDRNDGGISIGYGDAYLHAILLNGTTVTPISLDVGPKRYSFLDVEGINNWGSIVGWYSGSDAVAHGFKRWRNGSGFALNYPAAFQGVNSGTFPMGINDNGTIVGFTQIPYHAFVYDRGGWTSLEFPGANSTILQGISNAGVIVGNSSFPDGTSTAFLYHNGVFKTIFPPNTGGSYVASISLRSGLILGVAYVSSSGQQLGFVAKCAAP